MGREMTVKEARLEANVTTPTVISWCRDWLVAGRPIGRKVGGRWRIDRALFERFLAGEGVKGAAYSVPPDPSCMDETD